MHANTPSARSRRSEGGQCLCSQNQENIPCLGVHHYPNAEMHAGLLFGCIIAPHRSKDQAKHSRADHSRAKHRQSIAGKAQQAKHSRQKLPVPVFPN